MCRTSYGMGANLQDVSRLRHFTFFWMIQVIFQAGNSLNAVEHEPISTRVLNPNSSEANYKPKQRSYRKNEATFFFGGILVGGILPEGFCRGGFYPDSHMNYCYFCLCCHVSASHSASRPFHAKTSVSFYYIYT